jgi:hypothetical protein
MFVRNGNAKPIGVATREKFSLPQRSGEHTDKHDAASLIEP